MGQAVLRGALGAAVLTRKQNGSWKSCGEKQPRGRRDRHCKWVLETEPWAQEGGFGGGTEQSRAPHAGATAAGTSELMEPASLPLSLLFAEHYTFNPITCVMTSS